jgi:hypothetical protein
MAERRFPPPWSIEQLEECLVVADANGQHLAYVYFDDEPQRRAVKSRSLAMLVAIRRASSRVINLVAAPAFPRNRHTAASARRDPS